MNKGLVDDYVRQMILPNMDEAPKANSSSFQSAAIVYTLTKELGELKQAIKNKQEVKINWNAQGERVEEIVKDGMKTVIKHVTTGKRRL
jgi:NTP pyrophosphatase (non-canonical NTP hydrolase)